MKSYRYSSLFGVFAFALVLLLASQTVVGDESSEAPVEAPTILEEITSDTPVGVETETTTSPTLEPTIKNGAVNQPVFESPVAPPPISMAVRIDGFWIATLVAIVVLAAVW